MLDRKKTWRQRMEAVIDGFVEAVYSICRQHTENILNSQQTAAYVNDETYSFELEMLLGGDGHAY